MEERKIKYKNSFKYSQSWVWLTTMTLVYILFVCFIGFYQRLFTLAFSIPILCLVLFFTIKRLLYEKKDHNVGFNVKTITEIILNSVFIILATLDSFLNLKFIKNDGGTWTISRSNFTFLIFILVFYIIYLIVFFYLIDKDVSNECMYIYKSTNIKKQLEDRINDFEINENTKEVEIELSIVCNKFIYFTKEGIRFYHNDIVIPYSDMEIKAYYFKKLTPYIVCVKNEYLNQYISKIYLTQDMITVLRINDIAVMNMNEVIIKIMNDLDMIKTKK